jgi:hypothetical protein
VGESVSLFREPDAGKLPVRFDEREQETGTKPNRTEVTRRKPSRLTTGRLQSLRLFSTLLPWVLKKSVMGRNSSPYPCNPVFHSTSAKRRLP